MDCYNYQPMIYAYKVEEHRTSRQRHYRRRRLARNMVAHVRRETLRLGRGMNSQRRGRRKLMEWNEGADARRRPHHGRNGRYARTAGELPQLQKNIPHRRGDAHPFGFLGDSSAVVRKRHRPRREGGQRRPQRRRMRPGSGKNVLIETLLFRYGRRLYRHQVGAQFRRSPLEHSEREHRRAQLPHEERLRRRVVIGSEILRRLPQPVRRELRDGQPAARPCYPYQDQQWPWRCHRERLHTQCQGGGNAVKPC